MLGDIALLSPHRLIRRRLTCGVIRVENPLTNRMFARSIQPDIVSLFSSTGSDPLGLFSVQADGSLPSDSFIHLLNDSTSLPAPPPPAALITAPSVYRDQQTDTSRGHQLNQTVLHIQSPTLRKTFIQCPPSVPASHASSDGGVLGLKHTWLHIQVRNLGRDWSFEVGIVDKAGRQGTVRCSTFQVHLSFFYDRFRARRHRARIVMINHSRRTIPEIARARA